MTNSQRLSSVRQKLHAWFLDRQTGEPWEVRESILIRQGFYCGRRFDFAGYRAVWFVEEDQVKIYHRDGALVASFRPVEATSSLPIDQPALPAIHRPHSDTLAAADRQPQVGPPPDMGDAPVRRAA